MIPESPGALGSSRQALTICFLGVLPNRAAPSLALLLISVNAGFPGSSLHPRFERSLVLSVLPEGWWAVSFVLAFMQGLLTPHLPPSGSLSFFHLVETWVAVVQLLSCV